MCNYCLYLNIIIPRILLQGNSSDTLIAQIRQNAPKRTDCVMHVLAVTICSANARTGCYNMLCQRTYWLLQYALPTHILAVTICSANACTGCYNMLCQCTYWLLQYALSKCRSHGHLGSLPR